MRQVGNVKLVLCSLGNLYIKKSVNKRHFKSPPKLTMFTILYRQENNSEYIVKGTKCKFRRYRGRLLKTKA